MKRGKLKRFTPIRRKTKMRPMSAKRSLTWPIYIAQIQEAKAAQIRERGYTYCSKCGRQCAPGPHHPWGRAGLNLFRFVMLGWKCCHLSIHENARASKESGDLIDSTKKPTNT